MQLINQEEENNFWNSNHFAISALFLLLTNCSYLWSEQSELFIYGIHHSKN